MSLWICHTCGVEYSDTERPPQECLICTDERQYVPLSGQKWTTSEALALHGAAAQVEFLEPGLYRITVSPQVGIGQQSLLVQTAAGNLLWEPPGFIDDTAVEAVRSLGGVAVISSSHPHLTGASVSWSEAFDHAPVYAAEADQAWITRPDDAIRLWSGTERPLPGVTFVQCGGHFPGSSMAHWATGADGRGVYLTGDTIFVGPSRWTVSAMRSYPNLIPLPERAIRQILEAMEPFDYDRLYGSFGQVVEIDAREVVETSLERYITWIRGDVDDY
jgi:glyoxylase-like metal-dependent hydrolase (beta-lactamase superfamily II)